MLGGHKLSDAYQNTQNPSPQSCPLGIKRACGQPMPKNTWDFRRFWAFLLAEGGSCPRRVVEQDLFGHSCLQRADHARAGWWTRICLGILVCGGQIMPKWCRFCRLFKPRAWGIDPFGWIPEFGSKKSEPRTWGIDPFVWILKFGSK